jgi:hypothetical protein
MEPNTTALPGYILTPLDEVDFTHLEDYFRNQIIGGAKLSKRGTKWFTSAIMHQSHLPELLSLCLKKVHPTVKITEDNQVKIVPMDRIIAQRFINNENLEKLHISCLRLAGYEIKEKECQH